MTGTAKTIAAALGCAALGALLPAGASAQGQGNPTMPYDGHMPFNCELQNVGTGTDFPHPEADPFCVEFDKTSQNVTDLGIADFLLNEPDRVAAASTKCFYFQRDHWTGSVVQGQPPEPWHWDGNYFFDKAKGIGGVSFAHFPPARQPSDSPPSVPAPVKPYVHPGGGGRGALTH